MNNIKKYFVLAAVSIGTLATGCKKLGDFGDMNLDPTRVAVPNTRSLLTNAQQNMIGGYTSAVGSPAAPNGLVLGGGEAATLAQHLSEGPYLTFSPFNGATQGVSYYPYYTGPLNQLQMVIDLNNGDKVEADQGANGSKNNQLAAARIMKAYVFWKITDRWGDLPYEEALKGAANFTPAFQKQELIYKDLFKELKEAAAQIDGGKGVQGDIFFKGDMARWKKFAATQRMLMALRMSKRYPGAGELAATEFNAAMNEAIASNAENVIYKYINGDPNNSNPWYNNYTRDKRNDYAVSKTLVDYMSANASNTDPRLPVFAEVLPGNAIIGLPFGNKLQTNIPNAYSRIGKDLQKQDSPAYIFTYAQVLFAKAEAAKLGWIPGGDAAAKGFYDSAIDASLAQYGVSDANFKNVVGVAYDATKAIQQISTQRWIHLFLDSYEAWAEWRRTGFPVLAPGPNTTVAAIPRRLVYPVADKTTNEDNYKAVVAQQGADKVDTRIWWDK